MKANPVPGHTWPRRNSEASRGELLKYPLTSYFVRFFEEGASRLEFFRPFYPKKTTQNLEGLDTAEHRDTDAVLFKDRSQCRIFSHTRTLNLHGEQLCYWPWPESWLLESKNGRPIRSTSFFASSISPKKLLSTCVLEEDFKDTKEVEKSSGLMATMQADQENHRVGQEYHYLE